MPTGLRPIGAYAPEGERDFQHTPAKNETRVNSILINDYLRIL